MSDNEKQELEAISTKYPMLVKGHDKLGGKALKPLRTIKAIKAALEELEES